jgi:hypothetical protein
MTRALACFFAALALAAADDPWAAVQAIRSGAELRIYKRGVAEPVLAAMDELREQSLFVVVKNAQVAIPRDQIERIDARPPQTAPRVTREERTKTETGRDGKQNTSVSSGLSFGSKPGFETVYRRTTARSK